MYHQSGTSLAKVNAQPYMIARLVFTCRLPLHSMQFFPWLLFVGCVVGFIGNGHFKSMLFNGVRIGKLQMLCSAIFVLHPVPINVLTVCFGIFNGAIAFQVKGGLMMRRATGGALGTPSTKVGRVALHALKAPIVTELPIVGPTNIVLREYS